MDTTQNKANNVVEEMAHKAHYATDNLARGADQASGVAGKAQGVASAVADYAGHAKQSVQHMASDAADRVLHAKEAVAGWASETAHATGEHIRVGANQTTGLIRRYPIAAVLVGIGIGFLLAKVTRI